jgi:hypothetical protein
LGYEPNELPTAPSRNVSLDNVSSFLELRLADFISVKRLQI